MVAVAVVAGVLVLAGVVLALAGPPVSFGWFAYVPLSGEGLPEGLGEAVVLTRQQSAGGLSLAVGVALGSAVVGYLIARPRSSRP